MGHPDFTKRLPGIGCILIGAMILCGFILLVLAGMGLAHTVVSAIPGSDRLDKDSWGLYCLGVAILWGLIWLGIFIKGYRHAAK